MNNGNKSPVGRYSYVVKYNICSKRMKAFPGNCTLTKVKWTTSCKLVIIPRILLSIPCVISASKMFIIIVKNVSIGTTFSSVMNSKVFVAASSRSYGGIALMAERVSSTSGAKVF